MSGVLGGRVLILGRIRKVLFLVLFCCFTLFFLTSVIGTVSAVNCGGAVQCSCGDTLTSSQTMWYDLINCAGHGLVIGADDITLDCDSGTIDGSKANYGIYLSGRNGVTIKNCNVNEFFYVIYLNSSSNNTLENNIVNNYDMVSYNFGIYLDRSSYNTLSKNKVHENNMGINVFYDSNYNILSGNNVNSNRYGISIYNSSYNTLSDNTANCILEGFRLYNSSHNTLAGNTANYNKNYEGFWLGYNSNNNTLSNNTANNNIRGIYLTPSSNFNILSGNNVSYNTQYGIIVSGSNNTIFHNNIINNTIQGVSPPDNNWYHPDLLEGNYWSDYNGLDNGNGTGKHAIAGDGIGDTEIPHPSEGYDYYPYVNESGWLIMPEDSDNDGIPDSIDACPNIYGIFCNGCPEPECLGCAISYCPSTGEPYCVGDDTQCLPTVCPEDGCGVGTCDNNETGTYTSVDNVCEITGNEGTCTENPYNLTCEFDRICELEHRVEELEEQVQSNTERITALELLMEQIKDLINMIICQLLPKGLVKDITCPVF